MRDSLIDLIKKTIVFQYSLPNIDPAITKTVHTHEEDHCYKVDNENDIVTIIYNGIIDYSYNETKIDLTKLEALQIRALKSKLRYNEDSDNITKQKYGFYGEILLYVILNTIYGVETLISRGYFYNPLENSETKGYDTYQLIEKRDESIELWFGEVKFYEDYKAALRKIFDNIDKAISDDYLNKNIIAISDRGEFNVVDSKIEQIVKAWEDNPEINIVDEIKKHNMSFIYPILVVFDHKNKQYDDLIAELIDHINSTYPLKDFALTIDYKIFFIFLPMSEVGKIKREVIQWIESKQPLIS